MSNQEYPFGSIESKWQKQWQKEKLFQVNPNGENPYYCLMMFPYPSAALHVGHGRNYIMGDVLVRYKMMKGFDVLSPMGFDAFGLPAENAAIKNNIHPMTYTQQNIKHMKDQLLSWGVGYDWDREVVSCDPSYYKWTQWLFIQMYKKGLAFKKKAEVNWCISCATVLANEQVVDKKCERCDSDVELKNLDQWFFKITDYADRLINDLDHLEHWPERVKTMQVNWIGRSKGTCIDFKIDDSEKSLSVFTTRPDTLYGVTYLVLSPEHPWINSLTEKESTHSEVMDFLKDVQKEDPEKRSSGDLPKKGIFTGRYVIHPLTSEKIPLWIANYVLMDYGTGAVMAVPAHDTRDFAFASAYDLPIKVVIQPPNTSLSSTTLDEAYIEEGVMVNSEDCDGLPNKKASKQITKKLISLGKGSTQINYRLRDWLISRQRYWGAPIPMIKCDSCGYVPVPEEDLPVRLPETVAFKGKGESPLAKVESFLHTSCPQCQKPAKREIDTMDTFVDSSWYFLRYLSPSNDEKIFDSELVNKWLPVDKYVGGIEHAILHLLYARFITKVIYDIGLIDFQEPFNHLFTQGMIVKDGAKMSKSKGNVVNPNLLIQKYGADTQRLYILFMGPPERDVEWNDDGILGAHRFLKRVWTLAKDEEPLIQKILKTHRNALDDIFEDISLTSTDKKIRKKVHQTIQKVSQSMDPKMSFNTAISACMELVNDLYLYDQKDNKLRGPIFTEAMLSLIKLLAPIVPHLSEELWQSWGYNESVFKSSWPTFSKDLTIDDEIELVIQVNGKLKSKIMVPAGLSDKELEEFALQDSRIISYINDKPIRRVIIVKGKLVNIVI
ncbi:leucine--tRNA ligase [PVC group bacterium (ex Bugula neritina AB1)]|nr:leucine--tRNA ligase [PVC group bacterium (ex Bugula neritina AB1)]